MTKKLTKKDVVKAFHNLVAKHHSIRLENGKELLIFEAVVFDRNMGVLVEYLNL